MAHLLQPQKASGRCRCRLPVLAMAPPTLPAGPAYPPCSYGIGRSKPISSEQRALTCSVSLSEARENRANERHRKRPWAASCGASAGEGSALPLQ